MNTIRSKGINPIYCNSWHINIFMAYALHYTLTLLIWHVHMYNHVCNYSAQYWLNTVWHSGSSYCNYDGYIQNCISMKLNEL